MAKFSRNIKSKAPLIGFLCQTLAMPVLAYLLVVIWGFQAETAVSVIAIGCTPGGSTSNLFTLFSQGDVALSITMTLVSNLLSFGTLPLLLWMLTSPFTSASLAIPFTNVLVSLLLVLIPVSIGLFVKSRRPDWAVYLEKGATFVGVLFIIAALIFGSVTETAIFAAPPGEWISSVLLLTGGAVLGFVLARLSGLRRYQARTVALETGIQNSTLTIAILTFSFSSDDAVLTRVLRFPLLYSFVLVLSAIAMTGLFYWHAMHDPEEEREERLRLEQQEAEADRKDEVAAMGAGKGGETRAAEETAAVLPAASTKAEAGGDAALTSVSASV